jgi:hypothetical protein
VGVTRRARAVKSRRDSASRTALVDGGDRGSQVATLVALQRQLGNQSVSRLLAAYAGSGSGVSVSLHGRTWGDYDGGTGTVSKVKAVKAAGCECTGDDPCYQVSGVLKVDYHVDVTIEMPEMPDGLSTCQQRRVQDFLTNVLGPHEREHARRLRAYNGTTVRPFSAKDCGRDAAMTAAQAKAQEMHDTEAAQRSADADASSLAIDPFDKKIDLDC